MKKSNETHPVDVEGCIQQCVECHRICTETVSYCLEMGGKHARPKHITLLMDCSQVCRAAADFMIRNSDFHTVLCGICAEICEACSANCEALNGDEHMKECADACRDCSESCREMAGMAAHHA